MLPPRSPARRSCDQEPAPSGRSASSAPARPDAPPCRQAPRVLPPAASRATSSRASPRSRASGTAFDRHVAAQPREHDLELLLDSERPVLTLLAQPDLLSVERPILRGAPDAIAAPPRPYGPRLHADRVRQTSTRQVSTRYRGPGQRNPLDMARESRLRGAPSGARRAADGTVTALRADPAVVSKPLSVARRIEGSNPSPSVPQSEDRQGERVAPLPTPVPRRARFRLDDPTGLRDRCARAAFHDLLTRVVIRGRVVPSRASSAACRAYL